MKLYSCFALTVVLCCRLTSPANQCVDEETGLCELGLSVSHPWCWGYEANCSYEKQLFDKPVCEGNPKPWVNTMEEKVDKFWRQADFGYVQDFLSTISDYCAPDRTHRGFLRCSSNMRYCHARHLVLDFREYEFDTKDRFREDISEHVVVGGDCSVERKKIEKNAEQGGALQSWHRELKLFKSISLGQDQCDVTLDQPVAFIKLDAGVNMYHHFCDFVNLYAAQHINGSFSRDLELIRWDTGTMYYQDLFEPMWEVFTGHPLRSLSEFAGKTVCIQEAMFSLLPRMFYGLFFNMPLVPQCYGSGLMKAFSRHVLSRLNITRRPLDPQVQVTLVPRNTKFRNILNQEELVSTLKTVGAINLTVVEYTPRKLTFLQQLEQTHNSDVFITMHGAGLTHLLFLPDWGSVIELYNCEDTACYRDLAAIRGVKYLTWGEPAALFPQDEGHHPTLGPHKKFTNYSFKQQAFVRLVLKAVDHVIQHKPRVNQYIHTEL